MQAVISIGNRGSPWHHHGLRRFYAECAIISDGSPRKTLSILDFSVFAYLGPLRWLK